MKTLIYDWKDGIKENELKNCLKIIDDGGIVIFPTDTVYGIAANALNNDAIKKIYKLKKRNDNKPIGVLTSSLEKIKIFAYITEKEQKLINKYMPGALTIILKKKNILPSILTSNLDTVGVRIPNNKIALEILERIPYPLATTSANISGEDSAIKLEDLINVFKNKVNVIVDGGETELKLSSTIIKLERNEIITLRQGTLKIKDI